MLAAVERRTQHLLDSGGPGEATRPRYSPGGEASTLSQKSKDLDEWLRFLHKAGMPFRSLGDIEQGHLDVSGGILDSTGCTDMQAGVWIRMGNAPNITLAQQKVVEAPSS